MSAGIADPQIVEIIGAGRVRRRLYRYGAHQLRSAHVQACVMAAERVGITPIVRTPGFDPAFILRC